MPQPEAPGPHRGDVGRHRAPGRVLSGYKLVVHHKPRHSATLSQALRPAKWNDLVVS